MHLQDMHGFPKGNCGQMDATTSFVRVTSIQPIVASTGCGHLYVTYKKIIHNLLSRIFLKQSFTVGFSTRVRLVLKLILRVLIRKFNS
jgi:hypothetical protein